MPSASRASADHADEPCPLASLLGHVATGDHEAFAHLYRETSVRVLGLAVRMVGDRAQAEEVAQEVYLQVWRIAPGFDARKGSAIAWLLTLTHRRCVDRIRSCEATRRRDSGFHVESLVPDQDATAFAVERAAETARLALALATLSSAQREAIELAFFGGRTYRDVATLTGVAEGTAKGRIRDGLIRLRAILDESVETSLA